MLEDRPHDSRVNCMSAAGTGNDPHDDADDVDARFAELVASLDDVEDLDTSADDDARDEPRAGSGPGLTYPVAPWVAVGPRDWDATGQIDDAERAVDEQEAFVPPEPGPVLGGDPLSTMAWFAVAGVPLGTLALFLVWRSAPGVIFQAAGIVWLLGLVVLLWRMPARREPGDDDPGAVV